jgi:hypothetical protein
MSAAPRLSKLLAVALTCSVPWVTAGCGSDPKPGPSCDLDDSVRFEFTKVTLNADLSSAGLGGVLVCPEVSPDTLNGQLDAGADACEVDVDGCQANVTCDFAGIATVTGAVVAEDDGFVGRFRVDEPITCVYDVEARRAND